MFNAVIKPNFLLDEARAVIVDSTKRPDGRAAAAEPSLVSGIGHSKMPKAGESTAGRGRTAVWDKKFESRIIPQMTMATEHYNRIVRMIQQGVAPKMTVDIQAQYHDEDLMGYNTVAEIPGTDPTLKAEIVMMGGHLDSWHSAGGATDNAAGSAVGMEAARIIIASGLKPRRTIRVALWSGEEQGLNGSRAYVKQQFGEMKGAPAFGPPAPGAPKPELVKTANYDKLSAYYNLDNGTGRIRGVYLQGNSAVRPIFEEWLKPFTI